MLVSGRQRQEDQGKAQGQPRLHSETLHLKTKATKNEDTHTHPTYSVRTITGAVGHVRVLRDEGGSGQDQGV